MSQWYSRYKTLREREIMMEISNKEIVIAFIVNVFFLFFLDIIKKINLDI